MLLRRCLGLASLFRKWSGDNGAVLQVRQELQHHISRGFDEQFFVLGSIARQDAFVIMFLGHSEIIHPRYQVYLFDLPPIEMLIIGELSYVRTNLFCM